mgnify:CR=1 FL=1
MQNALKDIFGPMFEAMLQGELNHHLGYEAHEVWVRCLFKRLEIVMALSSLP